MISENLYSSIKLGYLALRKNLNQKLKLNEDANTIKHYTERTEFLFLPANLTVIVLCMAASLLAAGLRFWAYPSSKLVQQMPGKRLQSHKPLLNMSLRYVPQLGDLTTCSTVPFWPGTFMLISAMKHIYAVVSSFPLSLVC